ncbi:MAG: alpha/beta hydrolase fold domain-containing protein [Candidatus Nealsonbacteria bacterium]|nr:alpha/beta hydrolase fold domain-containing protein [Candidatus Nealsonbacteria bacterium]
MGIVCVCLVGRVDAQTIDVDNLPVTERQEVYKTIGDVELKMHIFEANDRDTETAAPAVVFFFGGGWTGGSPKQFFPHCRYFASRGMVAMAAEYRIKSKHGTTPFECTADGKSAVRWIRANAKKLGIDPKQVVAGGGSAGGHVAACTGTIQRHDEEKEDTSVSSTPDAMMLFNPVIDTTSKGYGAAKVKGRETEISPAHHVRKGIPPTIIFHGTADTTVPYENVERFDKLMREAGNTCRLVPFDGKGHGFFNHGRDADSFDKTIRAADEFLTELGILTP